MEARLKTMFKKLLLLAMIAILLEACEISSISTPTQATATDTPAPDVTPTPTTVWFPPTPTSTAFPTPVITPTADLRPEIGRLLLEDDFSSASGWTLTQSQAGSIAYGKDELTIAISETNAYLFSIREEPIFTDFYLEITAEPNLCTGLDEYGVLFRVSPTVNYYRFSLSCDGQVRLDRVH